MIFDIESYKSSIRESSDFDEQNLFARLPDEICLLIFSSFSGEELSKIQKVSKFLCLIASDPRLWRMLYTDVEKRFLTMEGATVLKNIQCGLRTPSLDTKKLSFGAMSRIASANYCSGFVTQPWIQNFTSVKLRQWTMGMIKTGNLELTPYALEYWTRVTIIERKSPMGLFLNVNSEDKTQVMIQNYLKLIRLLQPFITPQKEVSETEICTYNSAIACLIAMGQCGKWLSEQIFEVFKEDLPLFLESQSWQQRDAAFNIIGALMPSLQIQKKYLNLLTSVALDTNENAHLRLTAAAVLGRAQQSGSSCFADVEPNEPLQLELAVQLLPILKSNTDPKMIVSAACWSLIHAFKHYAKKDTAQAPTHLLTALLDCAKNRTDVRHSIFQGLYFALADIPVAPIFEVILPYLLDSLKATITEGEAKDPSMWAAQCKFTAWLLSQLVNNQETQQAASSFPDSAFPQLMAPLCSMLKASSVLETKKSAAAACSILTSSNQILKQDLSTFILDIVSFIKNQENPDFVELGLDTLSELGLRMKAKSNLDGALQHHSKEILDVIINAIEHGSHAPYLVKAIEALGDTARSVAVSQPDCAATLARTLLTILTHLPVSENRQVSESVSTLTQATLTTLALLIRPNSLLYLPYVTDMVNVIPVLFERNSNEGCLKAALGLLGDLLTMYGINMAALFPNQKISNLLSQGVMSLNRETREVAEWAELLIEELRAPSSPMVDTSYQQNSEDVSRDK